VVSPRPTSEWALDEDDDLDDLELVKQANPASWQTPELLRERHDSPSMLSWQWARFAALRMPGTMDLVGWGVGRFLRRAPRARAIPALEVISGLELRTAGAILELAAAGSRAAVVLGTSRTDCEHVLVWDASGKALLRAEPAAPCASETHALGRLRFSGAAVHWSTEWQCGNAECSASHYTGIPSGGRRLAVTSRGESVTDEGTTPLNLSCLVCREGMDPRRAATAGGLEVEVVGGAIRVRERGGRVVVHPGGRAPVHAAATASGVFYSYNVASGMRRGRVVFVPRARVSG
jgi:hypothetical protein